MKKSFIIKKIIISIFILSLMLNTGCWNKKELKELGVVGAVAIDAEGDRVKLTYEVIIPKKLESVGASEKTALFFDSEGDSVFDAIRNSTLKYNKKLYWPHTNIIYISEDCAKQGLQKYMDLFNRDHDLRKYVYLLIVKDMPASEIMNNEWQEGVIPSLYIEQIGEDDISSGKTVSIETLDFLKSYYTQGIEPVIGAISIAPNPGNENEKDSEDEEEKSDTKLPVLEGLYVFNDDKMVGYLDAMKTRAYNIITNKMKSGIIVSASPDNEGINSLEIKKSSCNMKVELEEGKFHGYISVKLRATLGEESGKIDITNPEIINKIEQLSSEELKLQIEDCIKQAQSYKSDIFGFGKTVHIKHYDEWEKVKDNWNETFATMDITVEVKTVIDKMGVSNQQLRLKEEDINGKD